MTRSTIAIATLGLLVTGLSYAQQKAVPPASAGSAEKRAATSPVPPMAIQT